MNERHSATLETTSTPVETALLLTFLLAALCLRHVVWRFNFTGTFPDSVVWYESKSFS